MRLCIYNLLLLIVFFPINVLGQNIDLVDYKHFVNSYGVLIFLILTSVLLFKIIQVKKIPPKHYWWVVGVTVLNILHLVSSQDSRDQIGQIQIIIFPFLIIILFLLKDIRRREKENYQIKIIEGLKTDKEDIENKLELRLEEIKKQKEIIALKDDQLRYINEKLYSHKNKIKNTLSGFRNNSLLGEEQDDLATSTLLKPSLTFEEFEKIFHSDESCFEYLEAMKWDKGFQCRKCGNETFAKGASEYSRRCKKCNYNESITTGTLFHRLHFSIQKAFFMVFIVFSRDGDITSTKLSEMFQLSSNTCWKFSKKIKEAMKLNEERLGSYELLKEKGWEELILDTSK